MINKKDFLKKVKDAIFEYDGERTEEIAKEWLKEEGDPVELIQDGFIPVMKEISQNYREEKMYIPQVLASAKAAKKGAYILTDALEEKDREKVERTALLATIDGEVRSVTRGNILFREWCLVTQAHARYKELLKNILSAMGWKIIDLHGLKDLEGEYYRDKNMEVTLQNIIKRAKEEDVDIIIVSAITTSSLPDNQTFSDMLKKENIDAEAVITHNWGDVIGAFPLLYEAKSQETSSS